MPYSGASDAKLPSNVKKLSPKKRRQWVHVWNNTYNKTRDESRAFASANAVVKKKEAPLEAAKGYLYDSYATEERRIPQDAASYSAYGATDGVGCASCHWFVSPNSCVLVRGDISPTGKSSLYASAKEMHETILESYNSAEPREPSVLSKLIKSATGLFFKKKETPGLSPFVLFRDKEDRLRFVAVYSNIFEDKHKEILTTESHKEYVEWVTENKLYPDLHLWHAGDGSKIGTADMIDFVDGFSFAAGVIDSDKEDIAYKAAENDPGVSHGFVGLLQLNTGLWNRYRSFEISVLPAWAAGNETLDVLYTPGSKELFMPFDPKKREYFTSLGIDEETINTWEAAAKEQGDNLKKLNINFKNEETEPKAEVKPADNTNTDPAADDASNSDTTPNPATLATKSELAYVIKSFAENSAAITEMSKAMVNLTNTVSAMQSDIANLKKPADQRAAEEWQSRASGTPGGFIASQQKSNKPADEENQAADDFFGTVVMPQVNRALGIGGN